MRTPVKAPGTDAGDQGVQLAQGDPRLDQGSIDHGENLLGMSAPDLLEVPE